MAAGDSSLVLGPQAAAVRHTAGISGNPFVQEVASTARSIKILELAEVDHTSANSQRPLSSAFCPTARTKANGELQAVDPTAARKSNGNMPRL